MVKRAKNDVNVTKNDDSNGPIKKPRVKLTAQQAKERQRIAKREYAQRIKSGKGQKEAIENMKARQLKYAKKRLDSKSRKEIHEQIDKEHAAAILAYKQKHHQPVLNATKKLLQGHAQLLEALELIYEDMDAEEADLERYLDVFGKAIPEARESHGDWRIFHKKRTSGIIGGHKEYLRDQKAIQMKHEEEAMQQ